MSTTSPTSSRPRRRRRIGSALLATLASLTSAGTIATVGAGRATACAPLLCGMTTIAVGDTPTAIASDGNRVWVLNQASNTVSIILPAINRAIVTLPLPAGPQAITYAFGQMWIASTDANTITVIEPTFFIRRTVKLTGLEAPQAIASDGSTIWIGGRIPGGTGGIAAMDPVQLTTTAYPIGPGVVDAIAWDGRVLDVISEARWHWGFYEFDITQRRLTSGQDVGGSAYGVDDSPRRSSLLVTADSRWGSFGSDVARNYLGTNNFRLYFRDCVDRPLASDGTSLWFADQFGCAKGPVPLNTLEQIDLATGNLTTTAYTSPSPISAMIVAFGSLWIVRADHQGRVDRVNI